MDTTMINEIPQQVKPLTDLPLWGKWTAHDVISLMLKGMDRVAIGKDGWHPPNKSLLEGSDHWLYHGVVNSDGTYDFVTDLFDVEAIKEVTKWNDGENARKFRAGLKPQHVSRHMAVRLESDILGRDHGVAVARALIELGLAPSCVSFTGEPQERAPEKFLLGNLDFISGKSVHQNYFLKGGLNPKVKEEKAIYDKLTRLIFAICERLGSRIAQIEAKAGEVFDQAVTFQPTHHLRLPGHYSIKRYFGAEASVNRDYVRPHTVIHLAEEPWEPMALLRKAEEVARELGISIYQALNRPINTKPKHSNSTFDRNQTVNMDGQQRSFQDLYDSLLIGRRSQAFRLPGDNSTRASAYVTKCNGYLLGRDYAATSQYPSFIVEIEPGSFSSRGRGGVKTRCTLPEDYEHSKDWVVKIPQEDAFLALALGHGKTTGILKKLDRDAKRNFINRTLFVSPFRLLAQELARKAGIKSHEDGPSYRGSLSTCIPSLHKADPVVGQNFVIEEINGLLEMLFKSKICKSPLQTFKSLKYHSRLAKEGGGQIILCDAFPTPSALLLAKILTGDNFTLQTHKKGYKPLFGRRMKKHQSRGDLIQEINKEIKEAIEDGSSPKIAVGAYSLNLLNFIEELAQSHTEKAGLPPYKVLKLTGETPEAIRMMILRGDIDMDGYDIVLYNKAVESGISIESPEWRSYLFLESVGGPTPFWNYRQLAGRVRNPYQNTIHYWIQDIKYDLTIDLDTIREIKRKQLQEAQLAYIDYVSTPDGVEKKILPYDEEFFELICQFERDYNLASMEVVKLFDASLLDEGATIEHMPHHAPSSRDAEESLKKYSKDQTLEFLDRVQSDETPILTREAINTGATKEEVIKRLCAERWGVVDDPKLIKDTMKSGAKYKRALNLATMIALNHPDTTALHIQRGRQARACMYADRNGEVTFDISKVNDYEAEVRFYSKILSILKFPVADFAVAAHPLRDQTAPYGEFTCRGSHGMDLGGVVEQWEYSPKDIHDAWDAITNLYDEWDAGSRWKIKDPSSLLVAEEKSAWIGRILGRVGIKTRRVTATNRKGYRALNCRLMMRDLATCDRAIRKSLGLEVEAVEELFEVEDRRLVDLDAYLDNNMKPTSSWEVEGIPVEEIEPFDLSELRPEDIITRSDNGKWGVVKVGDFRGYLIPGEILEPSPIAA